jgi:Squalene-hopene cyclase C-terminal domain/Prenyltransferase and squalene oxidase repeat
VKHIIAILAALVLIAPVCADARPDPAVKAAVVRALQRIEKGLTNYPKQRQCFSCHHQAMGVIAMTAAQKHGFEVDAEVVKKAIDFSLKSFRNRSTIAKGRGVGGDSTGVVYVLHMFAAVERPYDDKAAALVEYLLVKQRQDGSWPIAPFGDRPPTMGSLFTNVGLAMAVLKKYGPAKDAAGAEALQKRVDSALDNGRLWLLANKPVSTEDKVFHLRGLVDAGTDAKLVETARDRLVIDQREDGAWAQLAHMSGDAYATATALVTLRRAGLATTNKAHQKGVQYLIDSQLDDGAWFVQTRSKPLQKFFDNGDRGGKSQFISFAATNWAVLALLDTLPMVVDRPAR